MPLHHIQNHYKGVPEDTIEMFYANDGWWNNGPAGQDFREVNRFYIIAKTGVAYPDRVWIRNVPNGNVNATSTELWVLHEDILTYVTSGWTTAEQEQLARETLIELGLDNELYEDEEDEDDDEDDDEDYDEDENEE